MSRTSKFLEPEPDASLTDMCRDVRSSFVLSSSFSYLPIAKPATSSSDFLFSMAVQFRGIYQLTSTHDCAITCVAFSDKGDFIASGGLDRKLQIFSMADGRLHYSVITPSPVKSLIWLSGSEQMLVCACNSGILINVTIVAGVSNRLVLSWSFHTPLKDTIGFSYFRADDHTINFMAASPSAVYLATGAGEDIRIWKGDERRTISPSFVPHFPYFDTCPQMIGRDLGA